MGLFLHMPLLGHLEGWRRRSRISRSGPQTAKEKIAELRSKPQLSVEEADKLAALEDDVYGAQAADDGDGDPR